MTLNLSTSSPQLWTPQERARAHRLASELKRRGLLGESGPVWTPQVGPQTDAYNSDADVIGYGGAAGGGKSEILLGFAGTKHHRSMIFRREFPRLEGLESRSREIFNADNDARLRDHYNESLHRWEFANGATVRFAAIQYEDDKKNFQGRPYDFYGFDEATEFTESQVRFVTAWNRTTRPGQKCRVVMTFNPPMDSRQDWVIRYFAPWLDRLHSHPAADGEFRWYAMVDGKEQEQTGGEPFEYTNKAGQVEQVIPKSRTFFHATLIDNPALERTGYGATIDALPEPLRSLLKGDFTAGRSETPWQVIPAFWVESAVARWRQWQASGARLPERMTGVGVDVGRGGDLSVLALRYGGLISELRPYAKGDTMATTGNVVAVLNRGGYAVVDVIGIGAGVVDRLAELEYDVRAFNASAGTDRVDRSGELHFVNSRAAAWWHMRELLDPANGELIALPPDDMLTGDLTAPQWKVTSAGKIQIESKEDIIKRLGRSTDYGDAVVMVFFEADPLPSGVTANANPSTPSAFVRDSLSGGRWGRSERRGWRN